MKSKKNTGTHTSCRPLMHLYEVGKCHPKAWKEANIIRANRERFPSWPNWCYLPMSAWGTIVCKDDEKSRSFDFARELSKVGTLGAWRATQGIYRFDNTLLEMIASTPVEGDLPCEVLYCFPEWCVYVETPDMRYMGDSLYGFFAHLDFNPDMGGTTLIFLLDTEKNFVTMPIDIGPWSLKESMQRMYRTAFKPEIDFLLASLPGSDNSELLHEVNATGDAAWEPVRPIAESLLSLLLYLCSQNAEIGDGSRRPANPAPRIGTLGPRKFVPDHPKTWNVGVRLGSAIRHAQSAETVAGDGTHAQPRPHIRRAHWHGYWSGPTKFPDGTAIPRVNRKFDLRWLPPIAVNVDSFDDLAATIRPIKED